MKYKLDKEIPIPNVTSKYPFADMEVGDSFFTNKTAAQLYNASAHWRRKNKWKFTCRNVTEGEAEGSRIWRTE